MYLKYSFDRGNILFIDNDYYMILSCDGHDGNLIMMQLTGEYAGVTYFRTMGNIVDKIDKHYFGFSDLIISMCAKQKEKISLLKNTILCQKEEYKTSREELADAWNVISEKNNEIISLHDEISALKDELQECYEIDVFKNTEIERLQKEALCTVNKDTFDKAVNDMLNSKDISSVEEVSALMKIRALLYK